MVPGGLFWTRRKAGVGFRWVVPDAHDYFLPRPGWLSSKSGPDMIISCGDLRLVGSTCHQKVSHTRCLGPAARWGSVPKVPPEPSPYMVSRAVWLVALVFQKVAPEPPTWPVGVLVVAPMGWCSKSWGGVPKNCPRIPTLYTTVSFVKDYEFVCVCIFVFLGWNVELDCTYS